MLYQNCLSDCWRALCPTISVTLQNRRPNIEVPPRTVFGQACRGEKKEPGIELLSLALLFHSLHNRFCHFSCEQPSATQWKSSKRDSLKLCAIISIFKWYHVFETYMMAAFLLHLQSFGTTINTSDNASYELLLFLSIPRPLPFPSLHKRHIASCIGTQRWHWT